MKVEIPCICEGRKHDKGDTVVLRDRLPWSAVKAIKFDVDIARFRGLRSVGSLLAIFSEGYLIHGIESWTVRDKGHAPVEVTPRAIYEYLLDGHPEVADVLSDQADDLYAEAVTAPLLAAVANSSQDSPTADSTHPTNDGSSPDSTAKAKSPRRSSKTPTPLRRSSTSTTRTVATEMTSSSLDGVSNGSPSSVSAA